MKVSNNIPSWTGLELDGCTIAHQISDGAFSWLYFAEPNPGSDNQSPAVFKIAKSDEFVTSDDLPFRTQCLTVTEGGVFKVRPETDILLYNEVGSIYASVACRYVHASGLQRVREAGIAYYVMEYLPEATLRQTLENDQTVSVEFLIDLMKPLEKIRLREESRFHGDLKPEHIFITWQGARLIDPGFVGRIDCAEGRALDCVITTPIYYPFLKPDDLFAFGVIFWEIACRQQPLLSIEPVASSSAVGETVRQWVRRYENVGQHFLSPILQLQRPTTIKPDMPPSLEQVLLKGLRLQVGAAGLIEVGSGFEDFDQWRDALQGLIVQGITHL